MLSLFKCFFFSYSSEFLYAVDESDARKQYQSRYLANSGVKWRSTSGATIEELRLRYRGTNQGENAAAIACGCWKN